MISITKLFYNKITHKSIKKNNTNMQYIKLTCKQYLK